MFKSKYKGGNAPKKDSAHSSSSNDSSLQNQPAIIISSEDHNSATPSPVSLLNNSSRLAPRSSSSSTASSVASSPPQSNSAANHLGPPSQLVTGTLVVRIIEARNLTIPEPSNSQHPYALIEFDKNEAAAEAFGTSTVAPHSFVASLDGDRKNPRWKHKSIFFTASSLSRGGKPRVTIAQTQETVFLGSIRIKPNFTNQLVEDRWYPLFIAPSTTPCGELHLQVSYISSNHKPLSIDDFDLLKVIGKGSFGKVMQVRKKDTDRVYAMKIIRKANIVQRSEVEHTLAERNVLAQLHNPFIVNLKFSFQSPDKLYLVLAFVNGGELFHHLQMEGCFPEERSKFYAAELFIALECLHNYDIIYRDLKPENILLDYAGHIALCDFGLCKLNMSNDEKTNTFCGTPEYLAPELLIGNGYSKVVDWWTLGVLLYEMIFGLPPFYSENVNIMYKKILEDPLVFPDPINGGVFISRDARDILTKLLDRDPLTRLGANGPEDIKRHSFFADIDWERLLRRATLPPFRPNVTSATDTSNFDEQFTSETPKDSFVDVGGMLSHSVQEKFEGFTYTGNETNAMYGASAANKGTFIQRSRIDE